jgi:hypothetical protein
MHRGFKDYKKINFRFINFSTFTDFISKTQYILLFQIIIFGISLVSNWNLQYFNKDGNLRLIPKVSFQVDDPPFMPSGSNPKTIVGFHYFGDWTMGLDYGRVSNPFIIEEWPSQTPPVGVLFFRIMGILGSAQSYYLLLITSFFLLLFCINKLLKNLLVLEKATLILIYTLSLPSIVSFDRGSLHIFIYSLLLYIYYLYISKHQNIAAILFIFICCLKPQYLVLLLFLLLKGRIHASLKISFYIVFCNLLAFLFFPGQISKTVSGYVSATRNYATSELSGLIMQSTSIVGFVSRQYERFVGVNSGSYWLENNSHILMLPGLIWVLFSIFLIRYSALSQKSSMVVLLSSLSLVVPTSMNYTLGWAGVALIVFLLPPEIEFFAKSARVRSDHRFSLTDIYLFVTISICLAPIFMQYHNGQMPISIQRDATTLLLLLLPIVIVIDFLISFLLNRSKSTKESVSLHE